MKILRVHWVDSCSTAGGVWHRKGDVRAMKPSRMVSVGYLVADRKHSITLAGHVSPHQFSGDLCIPRVAVTKIEELTARD